MVSSPPVTSGIKRYKGKWGADQAAHLLKRTLFGVKKEDLEHFQKKSLKKAVRELIYTDYPVPDPPINNYND
ncbi:MAG: hypothetical protein ABUL46_00370, partial [Chitinophaga rupis]